MLTLPAALPGLVRRILSSLSLLVAVGPLAAQQPSGAYKILIPDFLTTGGVDRNAGRNMARFLREGFTDLPTHRAISRDEIEDQADDLRMQMEATRQCRSERRLGCRPKL